MGAPRGGGELTGIMVKYLLRTLAASCTLPTCLLQSRSFPYLSVPIKNYPATVVRSPVRTESQEWGGQ